MKPVDAIVTMNEAWLDYASVFAGAFPPGIDAVIKGHQQRLLEAAFYGGATALFGLIARSFDLHALSVELPEDYCRLVALQEQLSRWTEDSALWPKGNR